VILSPVLVVHTDPSISGYGADVVASSPLLQCLRFCYT
jgi:hypothetical protein